MLTINGKHTFARVMIPEGEVLDDATRDQLQEIADCPAFAGQRIVVMPDCHAGKGAVVGFTANLNADRVIPNIVGVDIGCGVRQVSIPEKEIDFSALDAFIRKNIPSGMRRREKMHPLIQEVWDELKKEEPELFNKNYKEKDLS